MHKHTSINDIKVFYRLCQPLKLTEAPPFDMIAIKPVEC